MALGFLQKIFDFFFGKKSPKQVEMEKNKTLDYVEQKFLSDFKKIEQDVFSKLAEIKHSLRKLETTTKQIKEKKIPLEQGNFRLRLAVTSSKEVLYMHFNSLISKLEPPKTFDLIEVYDYTINSKNALANQTIASRKSIAYSKNIMPAEIKELGQTIQDLEGSLVSLEQTFNQSNLVGFRDFKKQFNQFNTLFEEKNSLEDQSKKYIHEINELNLSKKKLSIDLQELRGSSFASDLQILGDEKRKLLEEKNALKQKFLAMLDKVNKPILRFVKLASVDHSLLSEEEKELATHYFQNVFMAVRKDPKAISLKQILSRVLDLVEKDVIQLKGKEKDKKIQELKELLEYDFFSEVFWKLNSIDSELTGIEKKISESSLSSKMHSLERELASLSNKIDHAHSESQKLALKQQQKEREFFTVKELLQQKAFDITGEKILVS